MQAAFQIDPTGRRRVVLFARKGSAVRRLQFGIKLQILRLFGMARCIGPAANQVVLPMSAANRVIGSLVISKRDETFLPQKSSTLTTRATPATVAIPARDENNQLCDIFAWAIIGVFPTDSSALSASLTGIGSGRTFAASITTSRPEVGFGEAGTNTIN